MVEKTRNGNTWTPSRFNSFITSALRRATARWGPKYEAKRQARYREKLLNAKGRLVFHSVCDGCGDVIPETLSKVDHIAPVVDPERGFTSWDEKIERMFCEVEGFQVLCIPCHNNKTKEERQIATDRKRRENHTCFFSSYPLSAEGLYDA